jgi:hypothetical protein
MCTRLVDFVHGVVDIFYQFFYSKIIQIFQKITDAWNFTFNPLSFSEFMF